MSHKLFHTKERVSTSVQALCNVVVVHDFTLINEAVGCGHFTFDSLGAEVSLTFKV